MVETDTFKQLLEDQSEDDKIIKASNPYGDGFASQKIADILESKI